MPLPPQRRPPQDRTIGFDDAIGELIPDKRGSTLGHHRDSPLAGGVEPDSSDTEVLARAQAEDRVLVTFDKDFGELAFRSGLPASSGVALFRISTPSSSHIARVAVTALESRTDWAGHSAVIEHDRIRLTLLPGGQDAVSR